MESPFSYAIAHISRVSAHFTWVYLSKTSPQNLSVNVSLAEKSMAAA